MITCPLEQTLEQVRALNEYLKVEQGTPTSADWIIAEALAPNSERLQVLVAHTQARLRTTASTITASSILQNYQWPLLSAAIACYLVARRVPDLSVTNVRTCYNAEHEAESLALLSGRFTALPNDPAADHPDVTVVADEDALREVLRISIEAHLGVVIDALCAHLRCKPRGLWLHVADRCASSLVWLMQEYDATMPSAQIEAEIAALIGKPDSRLFSRQIGVIELSYQAHRQVFLDRATCCYWYKTEGGDYCNTCPKRTHADRRERLLNYLTEKYAEPLDALEQEVAG